MARDARSRSPVRRRHDDDERRARRRRHDADADADDDRKRRRDRPDDGDDAGPSSRRRQRRSKSPPETVPNFNQSGLLAAETNTVKLSDGSKSLLKYHEPPEARKPSLGWRLYVFKDQDQTETLHIQRQSAYLVGRDRALCDIHVEHPSCSKQHAAIQHRQVHDTARKKVVIKPFIIDLESTNGTLVNGESIPTSRYYELKMGDVIKFGQSNREYVLLHDDV